MNALDLILVVASDLISGEEHFAYYEQTEKTNNSMNVYRLSAVSKNPDLSAALGAIEFLGVAPIAIISEQLQMIAFRNPDVEYSIVFNRPVSDKDE